jgi:hypothetical protein
LPFERNLQRYTSAELELEALRNQNKVGRCTLNQVDP